MEKLWAAAVKSGGVKETERENNLRGKTQVKEVRKGTQVHIQSLSAPGGGLEEAKSGQKSLEREVNVFFFPIDPKLRTYKYNISNISLLICILQLFFI